MEDCSCIPTAYPNNGLSSVVPTAMPNAFGLLNTCQLAKDVTAKFTLSVVRRLKTTVIQVERSLIDRYDRKPWAIVNDVVLTIIGILGYVAIHELGHYYAIKGLFEDVNPSISVTLTGGFCKFGGPAQILSRLGTQYFSRTMALAIVSAAGPLATITYTFGAVLMAHKISKIRKLETPAKILSWHTLYCSAEVVGYSLSDFKQITPRLLVAHDFQSISNLLAISRISLVAIIAVSVVLPCYLSIRTLVQSYRAPQVDSPISV